MSFSHNRRLRRFSPVLWTLRRLWAGLVPMRPHWRALTLGLLGLLILTGGWHWWSTRAAALPLWANSWSLEDIRSVSIGVELDDPLLAPFEAPVRAHLGTRVPDLGWRVSPGNADARLLLQIVVVPLPSGEELAAMGVTPRPRPTTRARGVRHVWLRLATWRYATVAGRAPRLMILPSWEHAVFVAINPDQPTQVRAALQQGVEDLVSQIHFQRHP